MYVLNASRLHTDAARSIESRPYCCILEISMEAGDSLRQNKLPKFCKRLKKEVLFANDTVGCNMACERATFLCSCEAFSTYILLEMDMGQSRAKQTV